MLWVLCLVAQACGTQLTGQGTDRRHQIFLLNRPARPPLNDTQYSARQVTADSLQRPVNLFSRAVLCYVRGSKRLPPTFVSRLVLLCAYRLPFFFFPSLFLTTNYLPNHQRSCICVYFPRQQTVFVPRLASILALVSSRVTTLPAASAVCIRAYIT